MASSGTIDSSHSGVDLPSELARWWQKIQSKTHQPPVTGLLVAFSGGADSSALLYGLHHTKDIGVPIRAIHVNHGLHPHADIWQAHCQNVCRNLNIPLTCVEVQPDNGSENAARQARYQALTGNMATGDTLLTAHHRDDQAETVLLQLLRGSGLVGGGGIPPWRRYGAGWLARPLLNFSQAELRLWLQRHTPGWIDDPGNATLRYRRNYLRHEILPRLDKRWPGSSQSLARSADHARSAWRLLQYFFQQTAPPPGQPLPLSSFHPLPPDTHSTWLSLWLASNGLPCPDTQRTEEFLRQCLQAKPDKNPQLTLGNTLIIRWNKSLYLTEKKEIPSNWEAIWDGQKPLSLPAGLGQLITIGLTMPTNQHLRVCFYSGGERIRLERHRHHKKLKKLFQQHSIPPWQRRRLPLVFHHVKQGRQHTGKLVAVGDWLLAENAPFDKIHWRTKARRTP